MSACLRRAPRLPPRNASPASSDFRRRLARKCAQSIEDAIVEEGPENVAALIVEPIVGAALNDDS